MISRSLRHTWAALLLASAGIVLALPAAAQVSYQEDYAKLIKADQEVTPLAGQLFGDAVSLYNGSTEFVQTDVSLPGNFAIPVAFSRRFVVEKRGVGATNRYALGDWDVEAPYISAVFVKNQGWTVKLAGGQSTLRCAGPQSAAEAQPPDAVSSPDNIDVPAAQYWSAPSMYVPGQGAQPILFLANAALPKPTDGRTYRWLTKNNWFLACKSSITGGTGDGFIARSPDGLTYYFDHMVKLGYSSIVRKTGTTASRTVEREEMRLYATKVEDRFIHGSSAAPNSVQYNWIADQLQSISASDGRLLSISWGANGKISGVSDGTRSWIYNYTTNGSKTLQSVLLPDNSTWQFNLSALQAGETFYDPKTDTNPNYVGPHCNKQRELPPAGGFNLRSGTIVHPSGALGTFTFDIRRHGRYEVPLICDEIGTDERFWAGQYPVQFETLALTAKSISHASIPYTGGYTPVPGTGSYNWTYNYPTDPGSNCANRGCVTSGITTKIVTVTEPDGSRAEHTFGVLFGNNEGRLLATKKFAAGGTTPLREVVNTYVTTTEVSLYPFPAAMGHVLNPRTDTMASAELRPQKKRLTIQDGVTFKWEATSFDLFARPVNTLRGSDVSGTDMPETTSYFDHYAHWVLGQVSQVAYAPVGGSPVVTKQNSYDSATAQLVSESAWGKQRRAYTYAADGTLATVTDGAGVSHATALTDYYRGVPRRVTYADSTFEEAAVNSLGRLTRVTDELGNATQFSYNATTGKLETVTPPGGDMVAWTPSQYTLTQFSPSGMGLPMGHWVQTVQTGNRRKEIHFDALLRPVVTVEWDNALPTEMRYEVRRYDADGRETFRSVPLSVRPTDFMTVTQGTATTYDALGRVTRSEQASELGTLLTQTEYLTGFKRRVTDPRQYATTTTYRAWDEPTYDYPIQIEGAEGLFVVIQRDLWGYTSRVRRDGTVNGASVSVNRRYIYDAYKRLCRVSENESGTTIIDYDAADNVSWKATGLPLNLSGTQCDRETVPASAKTDHVYDVRNRLLSTTYPSGTPGVTQTYHADGALWTISSNGSTWTYEYNKLRLLEKETLDYDGQSTVFDWAYDGLGSVASLTYPDGSVVDYAPDAFGRPTKVGSYAGTVKYHIDGTLKSFDYGNGVTHAMTQNARFLPARSTDSKGATSVIDFGYAYDANANVYAIVDYLPDALESKQLAYDGQNRLTGISNWPLLGNASFEYDPFDNLRRMQAGARVFRFGFDATTNRPSSIQNDAGSTLFALDYDPRGNLRSKGTQSFVFDAANRLATATPVTGSGTETYVYDGHGRRVSAQRTGQNKRYSAYTTDGKLRYEVGSDTTVTKYLYLGNSLLARTGDAPAQTVPPAIPAPLTSNEPDPSTDGIYTLNWSAVPNASRYELEEKLEGSSPAVSNLALATSWTTPNARPEGYHAYKVRACNSAGCSGWTGSYTIHVQFGTPPDAPNPLTASPNPSTTGLFTVSWSNVGSGITYKLFETTGGGNWVTLVNAVDATNWTPNTPRPIGSYTFVAHACNASGCSQSYPLTVTVQEDTTIPPPTGSIWASPNPSTDGNYTVQWTAVSGASYYKLYEKDNGVEQGVIQNSASLTWSPSSPRVTGDYEYWVKACKILGSGTHVCSEISTVHTERVRRPGVPPAPDWISFSANDPGNTQVVCNNTSPRTFTLYWSAVSSSDLDHYEILESNHVTGAMPNTIISRPAGQPDQPPPAYASFTRAKVPPDTSTSYYYQVRACNPIGGDEGCSGFRGTAEFCVGNTSGNAPQRVVSTTYYHTDALGSPVAETDASGIVTKRSRYEPYGLPANNPFADAPGYTGHVEDSFTQLSYMQQRYYDPLMGRFLSTDPLMSSPADGENFNRYRYANNNPYRYVDPDGRAGCDSGSITCKSPGAEAYMATSATLKDDCPECAEVLGTRAGIVREGGERLKEAGKYGLKEGVSMASGSLFSRLLGRIGRALGLAGKHVSYGQKIEKQMTKRGWTKELVQDAVDSPVRTVATTDTRHLAGGGKMADPATAYYSRTGGYVVRNDKTGDIVQVSDKADANWIAPWD